MARRILRKIERQLPPDWRIMPIGGTLMGMTAAGAGETTKDVDIVILIVRGSGYDIPEMDDLVAIARKLSDQVDPRKDQTSVRLVLDEEEGPVDVELVRGRSASGGYFVSKRVLRAAGGLASSTGQQLELPPEALAFLKAWGADDQDKLVKSGRDKNGYHAGRREAFVDDVGRLRTLLRDAGRAPDSAVLDTLFAACGDERKEAIGKIMRDEGWEL